MSIKIEGDCLYQEHEIEEMNRVNKLPSMRYVPDTKKVIKLTEEDFERTVRLVYGENAPTDFLLLKRELFQCI